MAPLCVRLRDHRAVLPMIAQCLPGGMIEPAVRA
jgi:hypothetical protein